MSEGPRRPLSQADARYGAARSRRLLLEAIAALDALKEAITVVGAHAVHVWVQAAWGRQHMTDALAARFDDAEVLSAVDSWIVAFRDTAASHGLPRRR